MKILTQSVSLDQPLSHAQIYNSLTSLFSDFAQIDVRGTLQLNPNFVFTQTRKFWMHSILNDQGAELARLIVLSNLESPHIFYYPGIVNRGVEGMLLAEIKAFVDSKIQEACPDLDISEAVGHYVLVKEKNNYIAGMSYRGHLDIQEVMELRFSLSEYELCLMSDANTPLEKGKLYIGGKDGKFIYSMISSDGYEYRNQPTTLEVSESPLTFEELEWRKEWIIEAILIAAHTLDQNSSIAVTCYREFQKATGCHSCSCTPYLLSHEALQESATHHLAIKSHANTLGLKDCPSPDDFKQRSMHGILDDDDVTINNQSKFTAVVHKGSDLASYMLIEVVSPKYPPETSTMVNPPSVSTMSLFSTKSQASTIENNAQLNPKRL